MMRVRLIGSIRARVVALALATTCLTLSSAALAQPEMPGMPDPRSMSGMARIDGTLAAGAITVRCLLGGFSEPAVGVRVTLTLTAPDGQRSATRTAMSVEQGRASFDGLSEFIGWTAVADATLAGAPVRSGAFTLDAGAGTRLLLVAGGETPGAPADPAHPDAGNSGSAAPAAAAHGPTGTGPAVPAPRLCEPNDLDTHPRGTVIVGLVDFGETGQLSPRIDVDVSLHVLPPGAAQPDLARTQIARTAQDGRATFEGLDGPEYPPGTRFQLDADPGSGSAPLGPVRPARRDVGSPSGTLKVVVHRPGPPRLSSLPFGLGQHGSVVLLTRTCARATQLPVPGAAVRLRKHLMTGEVETVAATTGEQGVAQFTRLHADVSELFSVVAEYEGAPFTSQFFALPPDAGAAVDLRVLETTGDPMAVRSAVQMEFLPREGGNVQVNRIYEVMVSGDKAYWPAGGLDIHGGDGSLSFTVMPSSTQYLAHEEGAPFARLSRPLPPGESIYLSVAYVTPHDDLHNEQWNAPFPLVKGFAAVHPPQSVRSGHSGPASESPHGESSIQVFPLVVEAYQSGVCDRIHAAGFRCPALLASSGGSGVSVVIAGLPAASQLMLRAGLGIAAVASALLIFGFWFCRRPTEMEVLRARQRTIESALRSGEYSGDQARYDAAISALDGIYRKIDVLSDSNASGVSGVPA